MPIDVAASALPYVVCGFLVAAFALPAGPDYALFFYLAVIPSTLAAIARGRIPKINTALSLSIALIVWSGCSLLWGHDDGHRAFAFLVDTACTLIYLLATGIVVAEPNWRKALAPLLIGAGAANGLLSMLIGFAWHADAARLSGWGITKHPILGAASMAVPYLLSLRGALDHRAGIRRRMLYCLAAIIMSAFILFTDSRGPLLAAATATLFLCAAGRWRWFALPAYALALAIWWVPSVWPEGRGSSAVAAPVVTAESAPAWIQPHGASELSRRGTSHRLEIWAESLRLIRERPILGHGLADNMHLDVGGGEIITFPHDLYLSLLFYSGIVGLSLFAAIILSLARRLFANRTDEEFPCLAALLVNALIAGLTDLGQITKGPGPIWVIVWLPVLFAATSREVGGPRGLAAEAPSSPD